jgi:N-acetylglucosamine kinase-like BadF-type ATPase
VAEFVIGLDVGGTGARGVLARLTPDGAVSVAYAARSTALRKGHAGWTEPLPRLSLTELTADLLAADRDGAGTVAVGCAGAAMFGNDLRAHLPTALAKATGADAVLVCSDTVTAFLGALAGEPGVVLAVGTGAVAVGSDLASGWWRVDGWGHVVGDLGGGAWIGRAGLVAALRAHDGRGPASPRLLAELRQRFTDPTTLIRNLYGREDQAGVLASFAPSVLAAALAGDAVAARIQTEACQLLADAALAARPAAIPEATARTALAVTGALLESHNSFRAELVAVLAGNVDVRPTAGTPCDGALWLAQAVAEDRLPAAMMDQVTLHHPATG